MLNRRLHSFYAQQEAAQACLSLFMSKCNIVGNHVAAQIIFITLFYLEA